MRQYRRSILLYWGDNIAVPTGHEGLDWYGSYYSWYEMRRISYFPVAFPSGTNHVQLPRELSVFADKHVSLHALNDVRFNTLKADGS